MNLKWILFLSIIVLGSKELEAQELKIARLKYKGGGDWYANPSSLPNLIQFCNSNLSMGLNEEAITVEVGSPEIFNYPFIHMTGHGNVVFSVDEAQNLRNYLLSGGFLHIDDNYGLDKFIRTELKKVFPEKELVELPFSHPIYHQKFNFSSGPPKVHEHDGKPAKGLAIIHEDRILVFYTVESDLGDGWEDEEVHNDPEEIRLKALKMGANIMQYVFIKN